MEEAFFGQKTNYISSSKKKTLTHTHTHTIACHNCHCHQEGLPRKKKKWKRKRKWALKSRVQRLDSSPLLVTCDNRAYWPRLFGPGDPPKSVFDKTNGLSLIVWSVAHFFSTARLHSIFFQEKIYNLWKRSVVVSCII